MGSRTFQSQFFQVTTATAVETEYDIVIVGAGFGGGTLAADLFVRNERLGDSAKKILVIEGGDLAFHSHCLNAARPTKVGNADKQSDEFFKSFRDAYRTADSPEWDGGPLYTLGGRSTVWGIFIPRPHDDTLNGYFPSTVVTDLNNTFFEMAESTLNISIPTNPKLVHWNLIHELNKTPGEVWEPGREAAGFVQDQNFTFAAGAYSSVDRLLEIAMNNPGTDGNFQILLGSKVDRLEFQGPGNKSIKFVVLKLGVNEFKIKTKHVVLCAGSVHSPAILLRTEVDIQTMGGGKLTDHDIYKVERTFTYLAPQPTEQEVGTMRLQAYTKLNTANHAALARITVNSRTLASRSNPTNNLNPQPNFDMVFILTSKLGTGNSIRIDPVSNEPIIKITRTRDHSDPGEKAAMATMTNNAMKAVEKTLKVRFDDDEDFPPEFVPPQKLGFWAHEVGSLPMPGRDGTDAPSVLDTDLTLRGYNGVSVCDNSVFPYSPSANPSLTLAALALRLSARLIPSPPPAELVATGGSQDRVGENSKIASGVESTPPVSMRGKQSKWSRGKRASRGSQAFVRDGESQDDSEDAYGMPQELF